MIEVYKYLRGLYPELVADIFTLQKNPYNIRNIRLFGWISTVSAFWGGCNSVLCYSVVAKSTNSNTRFFIRPDLKIRWFVVIRPSLQETCGSKICFWCSFLKKFFLVKYIILAMLTLESRVNFLFFLLHHFLIVRIVLTFLTHCPLRRFTRPRYTRPSNKPMKG